MTDGREGIETLAACVAAIDSGSITSLALTEFCLARAKASQTHVNAFIRVEDEHALAQARMADERRRAGKAARLTGVPIGLKDVFLRAGREASMGSTFTFPSNRTARVVEQLDNAGCVTLGVLNLSEFAAYSTGENAHWGDCRNPWDVDRIPGGSSSGCAAALITGSIFAALGTDTGGSGRTPAALCGVTGLKPTPGVISMDGVLPRAWSLDSVSPMARTALDCALVLDAVAQVKCTAEHAENVEGLLAQAPRRWRIGIPVFDALEGIQHSVLSSLEESARALRDAGMLTKSIPVPDLRDAYALADVIMKCEGAVIHRRTLRESAHKYSAAVYERMLPGFHVSAVHYVEAIALRPGLTDAFVRDTFRSIDAILLPACPNIAPRFDEIDRSLNGANPPIVAELTRYLRPFNYLGLPALVIPTGFAEGLPVGAQLVGRPYDDGVLLAIAHAFQQITDWHTRTPPHST